MARANTAGFRTHGSTLEIYPKVAHIDARRLIFMVHAAVPDGFCALDPQALFLRKGAAKFCPAFVYRFFAYEGASTEAHHATVLAQRSSTRQEDTGLLPRSSGLPTIETAVPLTHRRRGNCLPPGSEQLISDGACAVVER